MMRLCCSFASASVTSRNPSSPSVNRLNSKIYPICRLMDCDPIRSPAPYTIYEERLWIDWLMIAFITCNSKLVPFLEGLCSSNPCTLEFSIFWVARLYCASWLFLTDIVTSISWAFSASSALMQILRNFSRHYSVLMLLSSSSVTNLSLLVYFCAACMLSYRCLQMEWWTAVNVFAIPLQPAQFMWPCVSAARPSVLSPRATRAILHGRHPAVCILPILVRELAVGVFSATAIPNHLLGFHGIFSSLHTSPA